jgi:amino acid transporter
MADDGLFFKDIAKVHPRFKTPINAIILQSGL